MILVIGFLVLLYFVFTKNKDFLSAINGLNGPQSSGSNVGTSGSMSSDPVGDLARALNFTYTPIEKNVVKKELWAMGGRMKGNYNGKEVEMIMETRGVEAGLAQVNLSHSYTMDNRVVMNVANVSNKKFEIMPKSDHMTSAPTGNSAFDEKFQVVGDLHSVSPELMNYCLKQGWIHMKLSGNELTMIDDYFQQPEFKSVSGSMKMMSAVHPIWGTSAKQTKIEQNRVTDLLDQMSAVADALAS